MDKAIKVVFYIFLLGLSTYAWWKINIAIKNKIREVEAA